MKGGTGMLARVADGRRTLDVDLYREGYDKDQSLTELIRLAATDLGDHFSFAYRSHSEIAVGDGQPHVDGYHVVFEATLGVKTLQPLQVDLAASPRNPGKLGCGGSCRFGSWPFAVVNRQPVARFPCALTWPRRVVGLGMFRYVRGGWPWASTRFRGTSGR